MNQLGILPTLDKDFILSQITQEQIFEYYLGIKVETGISLITPAIIRPRDNNPTFTFQYSINGKLRARDWAGYFWGDCFDLVAHIFRLNVRDKKSFNLILDQIARDFRLHKYSGKQFINSGNAIDVRDPAKIRKAKSVIQFVPRDWSRDDAKFWKAGNIGSRLLEKARVYPCFCVWIDNRVAYNFNPKDPAYAYYFTPNDIRVYFPNRVKGEVRFITNTIYLQGIDLLEPSRFGVITKSYKDVISLKSYGIQAVAPGSETIPLSDAEWQKIRYICDHWFTLMDFDRTGILMSLKLRRLYGTIPLFFSNYNPLQKGGAYQGNKLARNFPSFAGVKDFYDKRKLFGDEATKSLIESVKEKYEDIFDEYDSKIYEEIKWIYESNKRLKYA